MKKPTIFNFTLAPIAVPIFEGNQEGWQEYAFENLFMPMTSITDKNNPIFVNVYSAMLLENPELKKADLKSVVVLIKHLKEYQA